MKKYRIGKQPHFCASGYLMYEGDIIEIPADQKPGPGWIEVVEKVAEASAKDSESDDEVKTVEVVVKKGGRAADKDI